ncbi:aldo/keto reductase [Candidatus Sulfurimonas marisnigri]|uniref:Aldo/keto reductase n=1 Tax=Candidatus Sulfurimonas marisnigri TaxID=2740405 RepID=A0A7S7M0V5_9BACT|nr:aldo/keto reductase [Candidatus Sulfurimonas marisnigri]QOY54923.1 aldo/keto reductase [Candidatus Sulfurimonas marisnigri]
MSNFAFGTYRISDLNPQHIESLKEAIDAGIAMIDTSSNYMDGGAERAIALAFRDFDEDRKNFVEIVSKFGYIQGANMLTHKEEPFEEVVEFSEDCFHSISKSFLHQQLTESLKRLEMQTLDCYLIHNPEYYLLDAIKNGVDENERLDEMYRRIELAFVGLEEEIKKGRIRSYGISSNSFSVSHSSDEFLAYEDLIVLADNAAEIVGNDTNSFTTIELPINMLEQEGLKCATWAKENGLRVLANRPLNAKMDNLMFRLADYDESREYYNYLNELMEISDNNALRPFYNLLEQLDASKHKFGWIGDYDLFLFSQIVPHMKKTLELVDGENRDVMLSFIDLYLQEYRKMVAYECSKSTKIQLKELFSECDILMQGCALKFLMQRDNIDYILVGMRKPTYVGQILALVE